MSFHAALSRRFTEVAGMSKWTFISRGAVLLTSILLTLSLGLTVFALERLQIPSVPQRVSATDGALTDRVVVSWAGSSSATRFDVYRGNVRGSMQPQLIGESTTHQYSDWDASPGVTYWYAVRACNAAGCSDLSEDDTGYVGTQPALGLPDCLGAMLLVPPTGLELTQAFPQDLSWWALPTPQPSAPWLHLTWGGVAGATSYRVFRMTTTATMDDALSSVVADQNATAYDDYDVASSQTYSYKIAACVDCGCSAYSEPVTWVALPPSVSTDVEATQGEPGKVVVTWAAVPGATSYRVHVVPKGGFTITSTDETIPTLTTPDWAVPVVWPYPVPVAVSGTSFADEVIPPCVTRAYSVAACNSCGCGAESPAVEGWPSYALAAPSVSASDGDYETGIRVTWAPVPGATSYILKRFVHNGEYTTLFDGTGVFEYFDDLSDVPTKYNDLCGTQCVYAVAARTCVQSDWSYDTGFRWSRPVCHDYTDKQILAENSPYLASPVQLFHVTTNPSPHDYWWVRVLGSFCDCSCTSLILYERQVNDGPWELIHTKDPHSPGLGEPVCESGNGFHFSYSDFDVSSGNTYRYRYRLCSEITDCHCDPMEVCSDEAVIVGEATLP
jgi:fibronectin type 3 domain-containing protein